MNMRFNFFTLLVYSPRGKSANALKSQRLLGSCKNGDIRFAEMLANKIISEKEADVFTLGRTAMASAIKLREVYPDKEIKIFAPFRTRSFNDNNILVEIDHQEMILSPYDKVILPN